MKLLRYSKLTKYQKNEFFKHTLHRIAFLSFILLTLFDFIPYVFLGLFSIGFLFIMVIGMASRFGFPGLFNDLLRKRLLEDNEDNFEERMELFDMEEPLMWIQTIAIMAICATQVWVILFITEALFISLSVIIDKDVEKIIQDDKAKQKRLRERGFVKENDNGQERKENNV